MHILITLAATLALVLISEGLASSPDTCAAEPEAAEPSDRAIVESRTRDRAR